MSIHEVERTILYATQVSSGGRSARSLENLFRCWSTAFIAIVSIASYFLRTVSPNSVSFAPPPPIPPGAASTSGSRKQRFMVATSIHARRYDIFIDLAAAEIDPVSCIACSNVILPGPIAISRPYSSRNRSCFSCLTLIP